MAFFGSLPDYSRTGVLSGQNPLLSALNQPLLVLVGLISFLRKRPICCWPPLLAVTVSRHLQSLPD